MTVRKFLDDTRPATILPDLLNLLDEYAEEKCSVLAGKIRAQADPERFYKIQQSIDSLKSLGVDTKDIEKWLADEASQYPSEVV